MSKGIYEGAAYDMRLRPPEVVPDIAVLKQQRPPPYQAPIVSDTVIYFGSGAAVVVVFIGLCIMAYMLIFNEGGSNDTEELYGYI